MVSSISVVHCETLLTLAVAPKMGLSVDQEALNSVTRGLVGDTSFAVLPNVAPKTTFAFTLFFQVVGPCHFAYDFYG